MIVVDANVLSFFLLKSVDTEMARNVYERDPEWLAPVLFPHEFLNLLATWYRKGFVNELQCVNAWRESAVLLKDRLIDPDWQAALVLTFKHQITAYDAQYVEVARARRLPLVTEDRELLRKFPGIAISMADYIQSVNN